MTPTSRPVADLEIRPLATEAEADACARMMSATDPWKTLGRDHGMCLRMLQDVGRERYVALRDGTVAGSLVLNMRGAFVGYLQTVGALGDFIVAGQDEILMRKTRGPLTGYRP